jgi:hypothetical protein
MGRGMTGISLLVSLVLSAISCESPNARKVINDAYLKELRPNSTELLLPCLADSLNAPIGLASRPDIWVWHTPQDGSPWIGIAYAGHPVRTQGPNTRNDGEVPGLNSPKAEGGVGYEGELPVDNRLQDEELSDIHNFIPSKLIRIAAVLAADILHQRKGL